MPCRATQDRQIMVKSSDKTWSTGGGNSKPLQYSCHKNPMTYMKKKKKMTPEDHPHKLEGVQYATGESKGQFNSSRKNEEAGSKQKRCSAVDMSDGESKVQCCKEQSR